jgi:LSD1 subclass zinc finger protein
MKKGKNTAEIIGGDDGFDDIEFFNNEDPERTLVLKAPPRPRRLQLIAQGAKEIRCTCCDQIKPLAYAEEFEEGWICEDCVKMIRKPKQTTQKKARRAKG